MTVDLRPLAIVEETGMHRVLSYMYLEHGYCLPLCKHVGTCLQKKHEKALTMLKDKVAQDAIVVLLTSDIWTSDTT